MLSIIVPVYNVKDYLIRCLDSISCQTFKDYEVIVVDDGSTDGSGQMADDYCLGKNKFKVFHKENGGLMSAWMYGLNQAQGEHIGFVDSDDHISKDMYQLMMSKASENDTDIVLCNHYYVDEGHGGRLTLHRNPISAGFYQGSDLNRIRVKMIPRLRDDYISPSRCSKVIKKKLLLENIEYCDQRISSAEDVNIMLPCMLGCKSLEYVDFPLYYYCQRKTSISNTFNENIIDSYLILIRNVTRAATDRESGLESDCRALTNFYGVSWCIYVFRSNLNIKEKKKQIRKLFREEYLINIHKIHPEDGRSANIYKKMMIKRKPEIFLMQYRIQQIALKLMGIT